MVREKHEWVQRLLQEKSCQTVRNMMHSEDAWQSLAYRISSEERGREKKKKPNLPAMSACSLTHHVWADSLNSSAHPSYILHSLCLSTSEVVMSRQDRWSAKLKSCNCNFAVYRQADLDLWRLSGPDTSSSVPIRAVQPPLVVVKQAVSSLIKHKRAVIIPARSSLHIFSYLFWGKVVISVFGILKGFFSRSARVILTSHFSRLA